jgi:iron complex transport system substrate-binding protein
MALEPQSQHIVDFIAKLGLPDVSEGTPEAARRWSSLRAESLPSGPDAKVVSLTIPGAEGERSVRVYRPLDAGEGPLPVILWFHGGGFVIGDLAQADGDCRRLATCVGAVVVSLDYRLAPEHPFPAAPEDCFAALRWVAANAGAIGGDASRLAVGGDSAGGNLAAVTSLLARDRNGPALRFQLLVYPVTDLTRFDRPSTLENATGYFLTRAAMMWFTSHYAPRPGDAANPCVSPLLAADLGGLPPALVITAEHDPLRDEGEAYAARLREAGVPTTLSRYAGTIHGFFTMHGFLDIGRRAHEEAEAALRAALHGPRVVSLLPSATEIVCALGAEGHLVGISHECDFPATIRDRAVLTQARIDASGSSRAIDAAVRELVRDALSIYAVDDERLGVLRPDVIVTQDLCEVCAVSLDDVRAAVARLAHSERVRIVSLRPTRLQDVLADIETVADAIGRKAEGTRLRRELTDRIDAIAARAAALPSRPRVASVEWLEPLMLGGTWMPELIELAGGLPVGVDAGRPAPTIAPEALSELSPDVVIVKPCGFTLERALSERALMERSIVRALGSGPRVYVTDGNAFFNRPGPRLVESLEILAACVHPEAFADFERKHAAVIHRIA